MFQLVFGIAGTGKSTWIFDAIAQRAAAGKPSILLVPEQFSSTAEGMAYRRLGDEKSALAEVLSFRTLAERILKHCGGLSVQVLGDADRAVYVRRALDAVAPQLATFARQKRSAAFCNLCAQTLAELKTAGAAPADVRRIAAEREDAKLGEIALIYEAYEVQLADSAIDPDDRLALAASRADCGWLSGKACFVDGFDGFTPPEYEMLARLMQQGDGMTVALCMDRGVRFAPPPAKQVEPGPRANGPSTETGAAARGGVPGNAGAEGMDLFTPVRRAAHKLMRLAGQNGMKTVAPVRLEAPRRPEAPVLDAVNRLLAGDEPDDVPDKTGLWLTEYTDEWEEVRAAAAEMRRLALAGVPYGKMALVCRDVTAYESVVRRQFSLFGIPYFTDAPTTIEFTAPVAFLRAGLALLRGGLASAGILALLKTGLCGYAESDIAALENYVFTWQPKAADWRNPFQKNPEGLLARMDEHAAAQLEAAERLRGEVVPIIDEFLQKTRRRSARTLSKNLYLLMDRFGAAQRAEEAAQLLEAEGDPGFAEGARRAWDLAMQLLDEMASLLGNDVVSPEEYDELMLILVRSTDFGQAPQMLECALFSGADRMRLAEPDYCFVVGAAEGEFPMQVGYSGLLTHADRDNLVAGGVEMPGSFENRTLLEEMFFYRALCAPRRGLYISWPKRRGGAAKSMSAALEPLRAELDPPPMPLDDEMRAATPAAAYDLLGGVWRDNSPVAASLYMALEDQPGWESALSLLREVDNPGAFAVPDAAAIARLVGREMTLSATVAEQYHRCKFSYYLEQVLRVRPRRRAELSPMESGTFVHYVLEKVMQEAGPCFAMSTDEALAEMGSRHADAFIAEFLPDDTRRGAWRLAQIKTTTNRLLCFMRDAAANSDFAVDAVELEIGDGPDAVAPLTITAADGSTVRVVGKIDRVDVLKKDGNSYLCIVDYKTGDKKLNLDEVYCGLNMQMMIYLDALCENGTERYPNPAPAGVLYLGGDPNPVTGSRHDAAAGAAGGFKLNGLLLSDEGVLRAMDRAGGAGYLPIRFKKDGGLAKASSVAQRETFTNIQKHVRGLLADMAGGVHAGGFEARPAVKGQARPCAYCAYRAVCRHEDGKNERPVEAPEDAFITPPQSAAGEVAP